MSFFFLLILIFIANEIPNFLSTYYCWQQFTVVRFWVCCQNKVTQAWQELRNEIDHRIHANILNILARQA